MNTRRFLYLTLLAAVAAAVLAPPADAQNGSARIYVAKPLGDGTVTITVTANGASQTTQVPVQRIWTAGQKRDAIRDALQQNGYTVQPGFRLGAGEYVDISKLPNNAEVSFGPGKTGESSDQVTGPNAAKASIRYGGSYPNSGLDGQPSRHSAGVATDLGQVSLEIRIEELPPWAEVDGAYIAQRLFTDLVGPAASLGAILELHGDEIEVTFDPAATQDEAGVIFGTTSEGSGIEAGIEVL